MGHCIQLARKFSADETASIVAFLKTLTGDQPIPDADPAALERQYAASDSVRSEVGAARSVSRRPRRGVSSQTTVHPEKTACAQRSG